MLFIFGLIIRINSVFPFARVSLNACTYRRKVNRPATADISHIIVYKAQKALIAIHARVIPVEALLALMGKLRRDFLVCNKNPRRRGWF